MVCTGCGARHPVHGGIPRLVSMRSYADSFGFQWTLHARTQLDSATGTHISRERFRATTRWPQRMDGERILEAGCGMGRFSEVALDTGAELVSFDLSEAVDANFANNGIRDRFLLLQASIYDMPLEEESFDRVFCVGVLQHTPDVKRAFMQLVRMVKPGGSLAVDVYRRTWRTPFIPKYLLRPLTKRLPKRLLYQLCCRSVPPLAAVRVFLAHLPWIGRLHVLVPVLAYQDEPLLAHLDRRQIREWNILDTFDCYSPAYDNPQTPETMRAWCAEARLVDVDIRPGQNGVDVTATKPPRVNPGRRTG